jgi:hypothetical protein
MNIPIHQGARVRLSIVVPAHAPLPAVGGFDAGGWSKQNLTNHIYVHLDPSGSIPMRA